MSGVLEHRHAAGLHVVLDGPQATGRVPLVLLHGAGGSGRQWRWVMEQLGSSVAPIAVDLPGHGDSIGPTSASIVDAGVAVANALDDLGVHPPVAVAAHSIGGLVGLALAGGIIPVSHLALVCSAARITPHPGLIQALADPDAGEAFLRAGFSAEVPADRVEVVVQDIGRVRLADGGDYLGAARTDVVDLLPRVSAETLVVIADGDPVISPRKSRAMAGRIPLARTVVLSGGHYLHLERATALAGLLTELLAQPDAGRTSPSLLRSEAS